MLLIGVSAKLGCGKTELSKYIQNINPKFKRKAYGDLLKEEASEMWDYPLEYNYSQEHKENTVVNHPGLPREGMVVREILQWHGTEFRRNQTDPDYWLYAMATFIEENELVIIDDVRFPNEADQIRSLGGIMIRLETYEGWEPGDYADHPSETLLDNYEDFNIKITPHFGGLAQTAEFILDNYDHILYSSVAPKIK